jgi:hypothetical protein
LVYSTRVPCSKEENAPHEIFSKNNDQNHFEQNVLPPQEGWDGKIYQLKKRHLFTHSPTYFLIAD